MPGLVSIILGGGKGTRLHPLTQFRSKPAVPLGGKYRLIDVPISNCINSGINRIYLLTQFNSVSLHRHIRQTYQFDLFNRGFVEILAAQQTLEGTDWYQGTADAVRKQLRYIQQPGIDHVLVLSGDQLYRMDYQQMLRSHVENKADVSIAALPVTRDAARDFGIMRLNDNGRVTGFLEKPTTDQEINLVRTEPSWIDDRGIASKGRDCLASMGIYLFNRDTLVDVLEKSDYHDFGREIFPMAIRARRVYAHLFDGYWEDIGTIKAFYEANLALAGKNPPFRLATADAPIYTRARFLPPTQISDATIRGSLIADGCTIGRGCVIENSVIGLRCRIGENVTIRDSVLMGSDFYEEPGLELPPKTPPMEIGSGTSIRRAIIDKNCRIGNNVRIELDDPAIDDFDVEHVAIRDGIAVVEKDAVLPDNWALKVPQPILLASTK